MDERVTYIVLFAIVCGLLWLYVKKERHNTALLRLPPIKPSATLAAFVWGIAAVVLMGSGLKSLVAVVVLSSFLVWLALQKSKRERILWGIAAIIVTVIAYFATPGPTPDVLDPLPQPEPTPMQKAP